MSEDCKEYCGDNATLEGEKLLAYHEEGMILSRKRGDEKKRNVLICALFRRKWDVERIPLKQGLKLCGGPGFLDRMLNVERIPLKQGLKLISIAVLTMDGSM